MPGILRLTALATLHALAAPHALFAGGGPQNVVVIANPNDPDSLAIANYYVELRDVPPANVVYIPWRINIHAATAVQFRDQLLKPLLETLQERNIDDHVTTLAFSSGYPYLIDCAPLFSGQQFPRQSRPVTSLTSAGFFYQYILDGRPEMFSFNANDYFAPANAGQTKSVAFSKHRSAAKPKYLLCTALGVTHGHGNSGSEITASLRRAEAADGSKPRGTVYYMQNKDIRSKVREGEYAAAVRELTAIGVRAAVLPGLVPQGKADVAGLTTGAQHVDLKSSGSTLLPGALVDNLTSAGGQMLLRQEANPQTRISQYIRLGAAGASGAVIEPFAIAQKFPAASLHVHYARGCSLAEAYYQSVAAPFHLLIIGDPLCQPWATPPQVNAAGLDAAKPVSGSVSFTPAAVYPDARKASRFELYFDGVRTSMIAAGDVIMLDTTKFADGWHEFRLIAVDDTPIAVEGAWRALIQIKNGDKTLVLKGHEPIRSNVDGVIALEIASDLEAEAHILHNGRRLETVAGGTGRIEISASILGKGRSELYAEQPGLRSKPLVVEVK